MTACDPGPELRTYDLRRTKATLIYLLVYEEPAAVQLLLGYSTLESTVSYLGIEVVRCVGIFEQTEI